MVERSEVVIVSVKPEVVGPALREVSSLPAAKNKLFISVAMGVSIATIEKVRKLRSDLSKFSFGYDFQDLSKIPIQSIAFSISTNLVQVLRNIKYANKIFI